MGCIPLKRCLMGLCHTFACATLKTRILGETLIVEGSASSFWRFRLVRMLVSFLCEERTQFSDIFSLSGEGEI